MTWRRWVLPALGLLAAVGAVWLATGAVVLSAASPGVLEDAKHQSAERLIFYRVDRKEVLRMQLPTGAEELRLVTHLHLPNTVQYAPERQYVYGVQVTLVGPRGETLLERTVYTRTRQSKADLVDGTWIREATFLLDPSAQLADERELTLTLPPEVRGRSGELQIRYPGQGSLLLRAYARFDRPALLPVTQREALQRAAVRVEKATFLPWERISVETQRKIAEERWERLGAEGEVGRDYKTDAVYRTPFRLPLIQVEEAAQERLDPRAGAVVNVRGPARLVLWVWSHGLGSGSGSGESGSDSETRAGPLTLRTLGDDGGGATAELEGPRHGEPEAHPIELGPGVHSVMLENQGDDELRFTFEGPSHTWFAPPEETVPPGRIALLPDVRRTDAILTGPSCAPADYVLEASGGGTPTLLRLEARAVAPFTGTELEVELLDPKGNVVGVLPLTADAPHAPFEVLELSGQRPTTLPCAAAPTQVAPGSALDVTQVTVPVTAPASARLFVPAHVKAVRVRSKAPVSLQIFEFAPPELKPAYVAPYREVPLLAAVWRDAPLEHHTWHPLRPSNHGALRAAGATGALASQVRLELPGDDAALTPAGAAVTLTPTGTPRNREVLEPDHDVQRDGASTLLTRLVPGEAMKLYFGARTPTRPELRYDLADPALLGQPVEVWVDGAPVHRTVLRTTRSRALLPPLPPGEHEVLLRAEVDGLKATLNRAPATGTRALRPRTLFELDGRTLRVPVRKVGTGAVTVNIVVYTSSPAGTEDPRLRVRIDGGQPRRRTGVLLPRLTRAEQVLPLPPTDREAATPPGHTPGKWYAHRVAVVLAEDLAPGTHWVEVKPLNTSGELWARFFAHGAGDAQGPVRQWSREGWGLEDAP